MRILIAPDSFKGSATAKEVAKFIGQGVKRVIPDAIITELPIADGGEGTLETLMGTLSGEVRTMEVKGPLMETVTARYGIAGEVAVIEMAEASGLPLVEPSLRNPLNTTTYGTGEMIKKAVLEGCKKIVVGIGGSATNDGGMGMAQALGYKFFDAQGVSVGYGGIELAKVNSIDTSEVIDGLKDVEFIVACDVQNVLCGPEGASYVYGPQKGGTSEIIEELDQGLKHFARIIKKDLKVDIATVPGSGAAGGLGGGLLAFCYATLQKGIEIVLDLVEVDKYLKEVDLVITGEGQMDGQSIYGKTPVGLADRASLYNVPVIAIVGSIGAGIEQVYGHNIHSIMPIVSGPMSLKSALDNVNELLRSAAERSMRFVNVGAEMIKEEKI